VTGSVSECTTHDHRTGDLPNLKPSLMRPGRNSNSPTVQRSSARPQTAATGRGRRGSRCASRLHQDPRHYSFTLIARTKRTKRSTNTPTVLSPKFQICGCWKTGAPSEPTKGAAQGPEPQQLHAMTDRAEWTTSRRAMGPANTEREILSASLTRIARTNEDEEGHELTIGAVALQEASTNGCWKIGTPSGPSNQELPRDRNLTSCMQRHTKPSGPPPRG